MSELDRFLYRFLRYGLFFVPFIPLVVFRNFWSPFNFGKAVVFRTLIEVLFAFYIPLAIKYSAFRPWSKYHRKNLSSNLSSSQDDRLGGFIFLGLTLFTISTAVSMFIGVSFYNSFWGSFERMGGLFSWLHYYVFFVMAISIFKTRDDWLTMLKLSVVASFVSTIYGFLQKFDIASILGAEGRFRILGTGGNAATFAGYLIFNIYFALLLFIQSGWDGLRRGIKKQKSGKLISGLKTLFLTPKFYYLAVVVIESLAVFITSVRGATIALFSTLFLLGTAFAIPKETGGRRRPSKLLIILIIFVIGAGTMFLFRKNDFIAKNSYLNRLVNISLEEITLKDRFLAWEIALKGIAGKPVFGWGPENFPSLFGKHYQAQLYQGIESEHIFDRAHNIFLDVAANQGVVGLIAFVFLWVSVIFSISRLPPNTKYKILNTKYTFSALILAYFIHSFFFFDLLPQYLMLMMLFGFVFSFQSQPQESYDLRGRCNDLAGRKRRFLGSTAFSLILASVLITAGGLLVYSANVRLAFANFYSTRGFAFFSKGDNQKGADYFNLALDRATWPKIDIRQKFVEAYLGMVYDQKPTALLVENLDKDLDFLIKEFEDEIEKNETNFTSYVYITKLYQARGKFIDKKYYKNAEEYMKTAIKNNPSMPNLYQDISYLYLLEKDFDRALENARIAHELNPNYGGAKFQYAKTLIEYGERDRGLELAIETAISNNLPPQDINWLASYLEGGREYQKLISVFLALAEKSPAFNTQLSHAHLLAGDKERARQAADKAMSVGGLSQNNFKILANVYKVLGNNKKRTEALEKSGAFEIQRIYIK